MSVWQMRVRGGVGGGGGGGPVYHNYTVTVSHNTCAHIFVGYTQCVMSCVVLK